MQRFEVETCNEYPSCEPMQPDDSGDWVRFADVEPLLAENVALKAANAVLTEDVACMEEDSVEMRAVCWEYNQANEKLLAANAMLATDAKETE